MRLLPFLFGSVAFAASVGVAVAEPSPPCQPGLKPMAVAELLFGRNIAGRHGVTEAKWARFLAAEITPRFPDGLTVYDARGQWRDRTSNRIARERSKVVMIVLPGEPADDERLRQIVEVYKSKFKQRSVGLIVRPSCVSF